MRVLFHILLVHHLLECFCGEALWSLNGQAKGAVPDQGAEDSKSSGDPKQHSVVTHLCHSIVLHGEEEEITGERERERGKEGRGREGRERETSLLLKFINVH